MLFYSDSSYYGLTVYSKSVYAHRINSVDRIGSILSINQTARGTRTMILAAIDMPHANHPEESTLCTRDRLYFSSTWSNFDEFSRIMTPTFFPAPLFFLPPSRSNFKLNTCRTGLIKLNAQSVLTGQQVQIASPSIAAATAWPTIPFCRCNNSPVFSPNLSAFIRLCRGHECS